MRAGEPVTAPGFDVAAWEILAPLTAGASVVLAQRATVQDSDSLAEWLSETSVTVLNVVPTLLRALIGAPAWPRCQMIRTVMCGGEALDDTLAAQTRRATPGVLCNYYGPTEAAVDAARWICEPAEGEGTPIGRPLPHSRLHVLDRSLRSVPLGGGC